MARKPNQASPKQAKAERLAADLENPASYFCSNVDCTQHVLRSGLSDPDAAEFPRVNASGGTDDVIYSSHQFIGPDGQIQRACDVCRSAIELVTGEMPDAN